MNTDEFVAALVKRFPQAADEITAWAPDYRYVLSGMTGADIAESLRGTLARWTKAWPPKPGEILKQRAPESVARARHPLNMQPMDMFGKPFGNGRDIPDLSDPEMREWQWQNGQMFLARLPFWNKMRRWMGDDEAAAVLKRARNEDEVYRLYDQWRHGESFDVNRAPPFEPEKIAQAMAIISEIGDTLRMPGTGSPASRQPSPVAQRSRETLRALADQHRERIGAPVFHVEADQPHPEEALL